MDDFVKNWTLAGHVSAAITFTFQKSFSSCHTVHKGMRTPLVLDQMPF